MSVVPGSLSALANLAWVLRSLNVTALARADGYDPEPLVAFRNELVERLLG
ncbi:hypothetical protein LBMAG42_49660 [Deltaproteobacteria bacterium]|nr:hypothetical protein LBMAG42_49660 [Deltaproteobacteria bacterium]